MSRAGSSGYEQGRILGTGRCVFDAARLCGQAVVEFALARRGLAHHQHVLQSGEPGSGVTHAAPRLRVGDH